MLLELFRKKKQIPQQRVIIEGGYQDDWMTHTTDSGRYDIPEGVNRLVIHCYNLDLVGRLNSENDLEEVPKTATINSQELDYNFFTRIQRPTTIVVDDGRVYHDKGLMTPPEDMNAERLSSFLKFFKVNGGFEEYYHEHRK